MNFISKKWQKLILFIFTFTFPVISLATCDPNGGKVCNPLGDTAPTSIPDLIVSILQGALKIGIPVIALAVIYSGFLFVFARGNSEKLTKAKDTLLYTLIGAAILLGSLAIATMVSNTVKAL